MSSHVVVQSSLTIGHVFPFNRRWPNRSRTSLRCRITDVRFSFERDGLAINPVKSFRLNLRWQAALLLERGLGEGKHDWSLKDGLACHEKVNSRVEGSVSYHSLLPFPFITPSASL